ncbi:hypothetical protein PP914_gp236 [Arthrobacter phage Qui]|jgi:hypothetical protein|uniref:Uncharacterized protein n=1 Tax=Arthrobacter phage Qui TaxID=2603260 RepID=A0A5B8WG67_9CAUD|nr:hypothetical protein PP914_gp236 [Arthrobacter phage Qui]QED11724.1 hypothetical protein SEA_QUI_236 [Arthrobacter phage Qui]
MKLSEYPVGTVIWVEMMGEYQLQQNDMHPLGWYSDYGHLTCSEVDHMWDRHCRDQGENVEIVSIPYSVVEQLELMVKRLTGSGVHDLILKTAIEEAKKAEALNAKKP